METFQGDARRRKPALGVLNTKCDASSFIRTMTVGPGISPDLLTPYSMKLSKGARGLALRHTAGGEFRPALKTCCPANTPGNGDEYNSRQRYDLGLPIDAVPYRDGERGPDDMQ